MNEEERIIRSIKYIINQNYVDTEDDIIGILIKALNLIEKQDKIINEMAEFIEDEMTVDEFCKEKNCYADEYINGHCQKCLKCIIEFYSKKVGE